MVSPSHLEEVLLCERKPLLLPALVNPQTDLILPSLAQDWADLVASK